MAFQTTKQLNVEVSGERVKLLTRNTVEVDWKKILWEGPRDWHGLKGDHSRHPGCKLAGSA